MLARYRAFSSQERRALWSAAWRLLVIRISLLGGIERTRRRFSGAPDFRDTPLEPNELVLWQMRATALRRAGARLPGVHCLARSLALRWWMRSEGIEAECLIGVRSDSGQVKSHAWVEMNGQPIDETRENIGRFQILKRSQSNPID